MYAVSLSAREQYRIGAKNGYDITSDVLKIKLNCLCMAGKKNGDTYRFGNFNMVVKENIITKVYWDKESSGNSYRWQAQKLRQLFKYYGLDENGNKRIKEN